LNGYLLKFLDNYLGRFVSVMFRPQSSHLIIEPAFILIIRPGGIGDAVLLLPMLQQLSTIYPDAKIEVLAERRNAEVFSWSPVVSKIWQYDNPLSFLKLFQQRYDLIIDTEQWYRLSAVVGRMLRPSRMIGFATNERSRLLTNPCQYNQDEYEASMFIKLLTTLKDDKNDFKNVTFSLPTLNQSIFSTENPYIIIAPGGSVHGKQWPADRFSKVARLLERIGFETVILGGKGESITGELISFSSCKCHNLVAKTSLTETSAVISKSNMMISGDSGLLHIAQLFGIPTVGLFGPTNHKKWNRNSKNQVVVSTDCNCAPCAKYGIIPKCHKGFKCMMDISVDLVVEAAIQLLRQNKAITTSISDPDISSIKIEPSDSGFIGRSRP